MDTFAKIKRALSLTCVIFTIIISAMYLLGLVMSDSIILFVPTPSKALLMLLFSAVIGFASLLLSKEGTSVGRLILHVAICTAVYALVFVIGGDFSVTGGAGVIAILLFLVIYGICMAVRFAVCRKYRKKNIDSKEYKSMFN